MLFLFLQFFCLLFCMFPDLYMQKLHLRWVGWGWYPYNLLISALYLVVAFCDGPTYAVRRDPLIRCGSYTSRGAWHFLFQKLIIAPNKSFTKVQYIMPNYCVRIFSDFGLHRPCSSYYICCDFICTAVLLCPEGIFFLVVIHHFSMSCFSMIPESFKEGG